MSDRGFRRFNDWLVRTGRHLKLWFCDACWEIEWKPSCSRCGAKRPGGADGKDNRNG